MIRAPFISLLLLAAVGSSLLLAAQGCKRKETLIDIQTPAGDIEVERDKDSGKVEIEIKDKTE